MAARKKPGKAMTARAHAPRTIQQRHVATFLAVLEATGHVTRAAAEAGFARQRFYELRDVDQEFAEAWEVAQERGEAVIEAEVRRRAIEGIERPVLHQGQIVNVWIGPDGRLLADGEEKTVEGARLSPLVLREYSDRLLELLAKAHNPAYRDRGGDGGIHFGDGAKVVLLPGTSSSLDEWAALVRQFGAQGEPT